MDKPQNHASEVENQPKNFIKVRSLIEKHLAEKDLVVSSDTIRFIELFGDLEFVASEHQAAESKLLVAKSRHEQINENIRSKLKGEGQRNQSKKEGSRWSQELAKLNPAVESGKQLNARVLDAFIQEFVLGKGGLSRLPLIIEEVKETGLISSQEIESLLAQLTQRATTIEASHIGAFRYKNTSANLCTLEQSHVLGDLIQSAFTENNSPQIHQIADGLFRKMTKEVASLYGKNEPTPMLAFAYDVLFAARLIPDQSIFVNCLAYISKWLESQEKTKGSFSRELALAGDLTELEIIMLQDQVENELEELKIDDFADDKLLDKHSPLNPTAPYVVGTNYERYNGLEIALSLAPILLPKIDGKSAPNLVDKYRSAAMEKSQRLAEIKRGTKEQQRQKIQTAQAGNSFAASWRGFIGNHFPNATTLDNLSSVLLPKDAYLASKEQLIETVGKKEFKGGLKLIQDIDLVIKTLDRIPQSIDNIVSQTQALALFINQPELSQEQLTDLNKQYLKQVVQIFHENVWMVADCGDRFIAKNDDHELKKLGIESLTFYPTTPEQRDRLGGTFAYRVELQLEKPVTSRGKRLSLLIDAKGTILLENGSQFTIPVWIQTPLQKLFADRLEFITKGLGEQDTLSPGETGADEEKDKDIIQRRAHWRKLVGARYSLRSPAAREHARAVLADPRYGVDIVERNLRGHASGRLKSDEWETFVMATVRGETAPRVQKYFRADNQDN